MPYRAHRAGLGGLPPFRHDERARCRKVPTSELDMFVPDSYYPANVAAARRVCRHCPLKRMCRDWAVEHDLNHGVYGGTTPDERRKIAEGVEEVQAAKAGRDRTPVAGRVHRGGHGPVAVFAAARDFDAGVPWSEVVARHRISKNVVMRALRVLRHAPDLVGEVEGWRMSMTEALDVVRQRLAA